MFSLKFCLVCMFLYVACFCVYAIVSLHGHAHTSKTFETVQKCPKGLFPFSHYKC